LSKICVDRCALTILNGSKIVYKKTLIGGGTRSGFTYFGVDAVGPFTAFRLDSSAFTSSGADAPAFAAVSLAAASGASVATAAGVVPEPAAWALLTTGSGLVGKAARRRSRIRVLRRVAVG